MESERSAPRLSGVMPAYNEEENVAEMIRRTAAALPDVDGGFEILVVDDGSSDRTVEVLKGLNGDIPALRVLEQPTNRGYGTALRRGISESRGRLVATIDSDGQFDPADIMRLADAMKDGTACVTGYRAKKKDTLPRVFANWGYNQLVKMLIGIDFTDAQCALKVFRGDLLREIHTEARGFTFPTEILVKLESYGHKVTEAPVNHFHRATGTSSIRFFRTTQIMFTFLLYMRFKLALYRRGLIDSP